MKITAKIKSEIYIESTPSSETHLEVNIFSRVKMEWVYNDQVRIDDILFLLKDLQVNPSNSIIRMAPETALYKELIDGGFIIMLFAGGNAVKRKNALEKLRIAIRAGHRNQI